MSRALGLSLILAAACVLAACAQSPTTASAPTASVAPTAMPTPAASPTAISTPVSAPSPAATPASSTPGATVPPEASELVDEARNGVAQQAGIPAPQVSVVSVQMVEWPDMSLGCPEPGMAYAQIVTPGYLIKLSAGGQTYEYHSDRDSTVITCANPQAPLHEQ